MRLRRFEQQRGTYDDLVDIPRHLAALHRYDDIAAFAAQATQILPAPSPPSPTSPRSAR